MKEQVKIPTGKVQRAAKFIKTGAQVGGNFARHYTKRLFDPQTDRDALHRDNADDIYNSLSELKGSALKVLQMMSVDRNFLPQAYQDKFTMAQYSAPPLSYPLVVKTVREHLGKGPDQLFDSFSKQAVHAASIGQVHQAMLDGKKLAVKVQYPGVAESITSDLKIVKPFAKILFGISDADVDYYMHEVRERLLEETDYNLELHRGTEIGASCGELADLSFPTYYPELSGPRVITMDWIDGYHLDAFLATDPSQEALDRAGQAIWNFYDYQIHHLHTVHADAHPGNFMFSVDGKVTVLDFGCVKEIPEDFYSTYFRIHDRGLAYDDDALERWLYELSFLSEKDSQKEKALFRAVFTDMVRLLGRPFHEETFDFGDDDFFKSIFALGERIARSREVRNSKNPRGSRHGLYINRTYFGLYQLLNGLRASIKTGRSAFNKLVA